VRATADDVRRRYGVRPGQRIALFAPTFRGNGQLTATYDVDAVPWERLAGDLGDDWVVMVKMHPFVAPLSEQRPGLTGVLDVSGERELNDLLMAADVLVTDYSSAIFEYSLLRRPIVFFCPDLEEYTAARDFYYPFEEYVTGPLVADGADLARAIATAEAGHAADAVAIARASASLARSSCAAPPTSTRRASRPAAAPSPLACAAGSDCSSPSRGSRARACRSSTRRSSSCPLAARW